MMIICKQTNPDIETQFILTLNQCSFSYRLNTGYIDLFLIHSPTPGENVESYKAMLKLKEEGVLR